MDSSEKWSSPSLTYCSVSSITMPEPLSAFLMTRVVSDWSSLRAMLCVGVRFGICFRGCRADSGGLEISDDTDSR